jgi:hypothetical protein
MGRTLLGSALLVVCLSGCGNDDLGFVTPDSNLFVVQAYLYAGEPVRDVTVTGVLPIDADSDDVAPPITNAFVVLTRESERFTLVPTSGNPGHYAYPGAELTVRTGDEFGIEVTVGSRTATATTTVPVPPSGLALSRDTLAVDTTFTPIGPGASPPTLNPLVVRWSNTASLYYFVVTDNVETNPKAIPTPGGLVISFRNVSLPTNADSTMIIGPQLGYYGRYRLKLYRVRDEYVDLYRGRRQDSRDLNEPPTNIKGALGIFTAFASDSAFFVVK